MNRVIWKLYMDYEKEEKWLNKMAAKGLALTGYSWCRYTFSDSTPGEYAYRIELLENTPNHPESIRYIQFLEESGIEHIASYMRWIYLRKKRTEGAFDLYSDIDSRIQHYQRLIALWAPLTIAELSIGLVNLYIGLFGHQAKFLPNVNLAVGIIVLAVGALLLSLTLRHLRRLRRLKRERQVHE